MEYVGNLILAIFALIVLNLVYQSHKTRKREEAKASKYKTPNLSGAGKKSARASSNKRDTSTFDNIGHWGLNSMTICDHPAPKTSGNCSERSNDSSSSSDTSSSCND